MGKIILNGIEYVGGGGGGASALSGLTDVDISSPSDGQVLIYDGNSSKWKNGGVLHKYSSVEHVVGVWTNNKPIYEITFHINALPDSSQIGQYVDYPHNIANIDTICGFEGVLHFPNGNALGPVRVGFSVPAGFNYQISIDSYCTTSYIRIAVGADRSTVSADYTIRYTKTTD